MHPTSPLHTRPTLDIVRLWRDIPPGPKSLQGPYVAFRHHELTHSQHNLSRAAAKAVSALLQASAAVFPLPRLVGHVQETVTFIGLRQYGRRSVCSCGKHFCRSGVVLRGHVYLRTTTGFHHEGCT